VLVGAAGVAVGCSALGVAVTTTQADDTMICPSPTVTVHPACAAAVPVPKMKNAATMTRAATYAGMCRVRRVGFFIDDSPCTKLHATKIHQ
jgi:hypothetical protein